MAYIFGLLEQGVPLSEVTAQAKQVGFTEPDPRDDLSGMDVARKLLVIARESGLMLNLEDVVIESLQPGEFGVFLGTAHPAKLQEAVQNILGRTIDVPEVLLSASRKTSLNGLIDANYASLKTQLVALS